MHEETTPPADRPPGPEDVYRELTEAITRTESLGRTIEANLDDAEKEIEAIRQATRIPDAVGPPRS